MISDLLELALYQVRKQGEKEEEETVVVTARWTWAGVGSSAPIGWQISNAWWLCGVIR